MQLEVQPGMVLWPRVLGSPSHVVLSEPFGPDLQVLVVNWTTLGEESADAACLLQAGEHLAVRHRSTMAYSRAHLWRKEKILLALANVAVREMAPVSTLVLQRMVAGAYQSPELRAEWKARLPRF